MNAFAEAEGDWNNEPSLLKLLHISSSLAYDGGKASRYESNGG